MLGGGGGQGRTVYVRWGRRTWATSCVRWGKRTRKDHMCNVKEEDLVCYVGEEDLGGPMCYVGEEDQGGPHMFLLD